MSIWGKIFGTAAGFAIGGPLGALLGTAAGHAVDRKRDDEAASADSTAADSMAADPMAEDATQSIAFTIGVVVLSAKMAKADGMVRRVEVETFKRLFQVPPDEMRNVGRVFDQARKDSAGFEVYARQIAALFADGHAVLEELLECLLRIAEADDDVHDAELAYLRTVAGIFGFSDAEFERILSEHCMTCGRRDVSPHAVLGLAADADEETLRATYRSLVREHHPDRLIARGLPEEFVAQATERMAAINAAYDRIRKERAMA